MPDALRIVKQFFPDVERVKDARADVEIEVTKADTNSAAVKNHKACAMAVACKRAMRVDGAIVSLGTVYLIKDDEATRYRVPQSVSRELVAFDRGGSFAPGEYTLKKPERASQRKPRQDHKTGRRTQSPRHVTANIRTALTSA